MKRIKGRWTRLFVIMATIIVVFVTVVIIFISPIAKYLIERYSEKYTGRQIRIGWMYLNPFTGYAHLSNVRIQEYKSDSTFFSAGGLSLNFAMGKLLSKTYEINELTLDRVNLKFIQSTKDSLNITDLITRYAPKEKADSLREPVHFNILNIRISNSNIYYVEKKIPINYFIKDFNFETKGKYWNSDTLAGKFSFKSGPATGDVQGVFTIDLNKLDYTFDGTVRKFDLHFFEQYLHGLANYGSFTANADADIKLGGNFKDQKDLKSSGLFAINDFHLGKTPGDDYAAFNKLAFDIKAIDTKANSFLLNSVLLYHPFLKFERYDHLNNIERMFGVKGAAIKNAKADQEEFNLILELAKYVKEVGKIFLRSYYKVGKVAVYDGNLKYNDFAVHEKFSVNLDPLFVNADSLDKNNKRVYITLKSGIKPYGSTSISLSLDPKNNDTFDVTYRLENLPASLFNPYLITYTSFPLDRGTIQLDGVWNVRDNIINSTNHILIVDARTTHRIRSKDVRWIPVPLILSFVREAGNVIEYEIPITGDLKNPHFSPWDVIKQVIENVIVKPPTVPYMLHVKREEQKVEKFMQLRWDIRQAALYPSQERFVKAIATFVKENPEASIELFPEEFADRERENIYFFEAKKKYLLLSEERKEKFISEEDSIKLDKMSIKDSTFVKFLDRWSGKLDFNTVQEKCIHFVGEPLVEAKYKQLIDSRKKAVMEQFEEAGVGNRIKIHEEKDGIPYNGFSFYKIQYKGERPEKLVKAYKKMNELNSEEPRVRFKFLRKLQDRHALRAK